MGPVILARPSPTVSTETAGEPRMEAPGRISGYSGTLVSPGKRNPNGVGYRARPKSPKYRLPSLCSGHLRAEEKTRILLKTGCRDTRPGRASQAAMRVALALAAGAFGLACNQGNATSSSPEQPIEISTPELEHASWKITTAATGAVGRVTRIEKKRIEESRPQLKELVREVYDSMFSNQRERKAVAIEYFAKRAGGLWLSTRSGPTAETDRVRALSRRAAITIQRDGARRATVQVGIKAKVIEAGRRLRFLHEATLWVERSRSKWKVIAFDVLQRPLANTSGRAKREPRDRRDEATPKKKGARDEASRKKRQTGADG
jgi:hypothetical protein